MNERETLFEFHRLGPYIKVSALDVASQIEISITGDAKAPQVYLQKLAQHKLLLQLKKEGLIS